MTTLNGKKKSHRFRSDETVELADTESMNLQFIGESADDDTQLEFLNESEEMVLVPKSVVGDCYVYLKPGLIRSRFYDIYYE